MADERKLATILFADLAGSTALADEDDPERTRARLERFYDAMAAEIATAGGTVEKFAGDAVMAAFGAPEALEDHAERALHAALAMQRRLEEGLALRVGVNTGEVVVGAAREGSSFVSGDAVNVAARLEQAAEPGEILAGERTVAAAGAAFEFGDRRTALAKGKPDGVPCRPVLRAVSLMRPRGDGRAFVGRHGELDRLWGAYRRSVQQSRPVLVTVVGDPGVGKTRLMRELWERLASDEDQPTRRTGRCLPYGQGITFWPLAEVLKEHLGIMESDSPEEMRRRLGDRGILGLTLGLELADDLHPLAARDRLHAAWIDFLTDQAGHHPVVLLIEDVHWAEPPLLDLLERIAHDVRAPLLLLATARPDFAHRWDVHVDAETVLLEPLAADAATSLVEELASSLPTAVRDEIVRRAEGNPFFAEELIQLMRENAASQADDIPDSVQAVLAARIDLLADADKAALQAAAVIGRAFWTGPVYELVGDHAPDLRTLESRDFIRRRPASSLEGEVEYVFKHALTREVAYNGLTKARRAQLHAQFARWLEQMSGGRGEHAALLAHHYAEAVRPEDVDVAWPGNDEGLERARTQALEWLGRAADGAISRYDIDDALALLQRATALESNEDRLARLWRRIGRAHALKYDGESFMTAMQRALELCDDPQECAEAYAELAFEGSLRSGMWRRRPSREEMEDWTVRALAGVQPGSVSHVKTLISRAFWGLSGAEESEAAAELAERLGDLALLSAALDARGVTSFREGDFEQAYAWEGQRFNLLPQLTDPDLVHDLYLSTIPTAAATGRLAEARRLAQELRVVVADLTTHHRVHGVGVVLEVEELTGDWRAVRALSGEVQQVVDENRDTPCVRNARSLLICALAHELAGEAQLARELEAKADELHNEGYGAVLATPRARLALARGEVDHLQELISDPEWLTRQTWFALPSATTRFDVLAVVGEAERVEEEAAMLAAAGSYIEPFALRALGIAREDDELLRKAHDRFAVLKLGWHAEQTSNLITLRQSAS
jgi:class 3 adenylate cyclase/tetratricopeptide (TPR) repeat protein